MKNNKLVFVAILLIAVVVLLKGSLFRLTEGRQAIITQFGKPVGKPVITAGLHLKKPFVQDVRYVDKRILYWDGEPNQIPTKDKKYITVDTTARWRITDALKFIQTVQNEPRALSRISTVLEGVTRDIISAHNLVEAVRNSNMIIEKVKKNKKQMKERIAKGENIIDEEIVGEVENISVGREDLSLMIVKIADIELQEFGIKLIDVQLRRISYERSVEQKVYERMISERQKIAQKIRSIGKGEKAKIEGRLTKDLKAIESNAYRKAQIIRGKAEAKSIAVYAKALSKGPKFYEFTRSMDAYKAALSGKIKYLLSSDSEFLKYLKANR